MAWWCAMLYSCARSGDQNMLTQTRIVRPTPPLRPRVNLNSSSSNSLLKDPHRLTNTLPPLLTLPQQQQGSTPSCDSMDPPPWQLVRPSCTR